MYFKAAMLTSDLPLYAFKILNRLYPINQIFCALESHGIWNHQRLNPAPSTFTICKSEGWSLKNKVKHEHQPSLQRRITKILVTTQRSCLYCCLQPSSHPCSYPALYHPLLTPSLEDQSWKSWWSTALALTFSVSQTSLKPIEMNSQNSSGMIILEALSCWGL